MPPSPTNDTPAAPLDALVFDLGNVIIELGGVERMLGWTTGQFQEAELWQRWLASPAVRAFESGRTEPEAFAAALVAEFGLPISAEQFLAEFAVWPRRAYPGAVELLAELARTHRIASLSNSNSLHWRRVREVLKLDRCFHANFPSHELRCLKPDPEVYEHVARSLGLAPQRIAFFDDNLVNVEGARKVGMLAHQVRGLDELRACLAKLGLPAPA